MCRLTRIFNMCMVGSLGLHYFLCALALFWLVGVFLGGEGSWLVVCCGHKFEIMQTSLIDLLVVHMRSHGIGPVGSPLAQQHLTPHLQKSDCFSNLVKSNFSPSFPQPKQTS